MVTRTFSGKVSSGFVAREDFLPCILCRIFGRHVLLVFTQPAFPVTVGGIGPEMAGLAEAKLVV